MLILTLCYSNILFDNEYHTSNDLKASKAFTEYFKSEFTMTASIEHFKYRITEWLRQEGIT